MSGRRAEVDLGGMELKNGEECVTIFWDEK